MKKMPQRIENIINEFISGVNNILGKRAKKIILYGSYARGDYNKNSDIDIMILTDLNDDEFIVNAEKTQEQINTAKELILLVEKFINEKI